MFNFAAAISLERFEGLKEKGEMEVRMLVGRVEVYFEFVTLLNIAVAIAPKRRRAVPARPAAVPLWILLGCIVAMGEGKMSLHVFLM